MPSTARSELMPAQVSSVQPPELLCALLGAALHRHCMWAVLLGPWQLVKKHACYIYDATTDMAQHDMAQHACMEGDSGGCCLLAPLKASHIYSRCI
jgi:hypothetical protein